tara:strand:- start:392 stop:970 length:579 start_codon:yes stop_codon:yes gene_type:complete
MAKRKPLQKSDPVGTLQSQLNQDFNKVIKQMHKSLSTKTHSPVWTGFFASSWKVDTKAIPATEAVEDNPEWAAIKRGRSIDYFTRKKAGPPYQKQLPPENPLIRIRHPITKAYNIKRPVFIGNTAKYAAYALEGGKIQNFIQGRMKDIINKNMKEKKGKLFLAQDISGGFGTSKDGVQYGEFNLKDPSTYTR